MAAAVVFLPASGSALVTAALMVSYYAFAQYLLMADGLLVGVLFPILAVLVTYAGLTSYRHLGWEREKRLLRRAVDRA